MKLTWRHDVRGRALFKRQLMPTVQPRWQNRWTWLSRAIVEEMRQRAFAIRRLIERGAIGSASDPAQANEDVRTASAPKTQ